MVGIPGVNISILRQSTTIGKRQPLLISGRVTIFGFGVPTLVRVSLDGPSFDPQTITFDTFSSPVGGDYNIAIVAEKDGTYEVFAQALLPLVLPIPGDTPLSLPPLAESNRPPIVVGLPIDGGVDADLPSGRQRLAAPPSTPIEISNRISIGAPQIPITIRFPGAPTGFTLPGIPTAFPGFPAFITPVTGPADQPAQVVTVVVTSEEERPSIPAPTQPGETVGAEIISLELQ